MVAAEFDDEGFSAVASFFGKEENKGSLAKPSKQKSNASKSHGRLGLGATIKESSDKSGNTGRVVMDDESAKKKFLSVGKKRHRHDGDDNAESHEENADASSDDDDEGEGRTSAARPKKKHVSTIGANAVAQITPKKKKKKLGKKERAAAAAAAAATNAEEKTKSQKDENIKDVQAAEVTEQDDNTGKRKRKRRKARSKQKNIRKDHRIASERPEQLKFGHRDYAGRPLTTATREALGIKQSQRHHTWTAQSHSGGVTAGEEGLGLAIDDLLGEPVGTNNRETEHTEKESDANPAVTSEKSTVIDKKDEIKPKKDANKKKKKKRKPRYKNIA